MHSIVESAHIRQVRIFGPRADALRPHSQEIGFTTVEMSQYATVR